MQKSRVNLFGIKVNVLNYVTELDIAHTAAEKQDFENEE